jgi:hypothetical protein
MEDRLEALKQQVQSDFELTWKMMNDQGKRLDERINEVRSSVDTLRASVDKMGGEIQEGHRQMLGRMRLLEERFRAMIEAVQAEMGDKVTRSELKAVLARLEALENKPPAA